MPEPAAAVGEHRAGGVAAHGKLLGRYVHRLTLGGRVGRVQGCRLWTAAVAGTAGEGGEALPRDVLVALLRDHWSARSVGRGTPLRMSRLGDRRRVILERTVSHGAVLGALRTACRTFDPCIAAPVSAHLDRSLVHDEPGLPLSTVSGVLLLTSRLADRVASHVLPGLRLGGVVSGYADRHWLYRLLRARLLEASGLLELPELALLLMDEVTGLVVWADQEDGLLSGTGPEIDTREAQDLLWRALGHWGAGVTADDGLAHLLGLLLPAAVVPAAHRVQFQPAVLALHLTLTGGLGQALDDAGDALQRGTTSRGRYRRCLRHMNGRVTAEAFRRHIHWLGEAELLDAG